MSNDSPVIDASLGFILFVAFLNAMWDLHQYAMTDAETLQIALISLFMGLYGLRLMVNNSSAIIEKFNAWIASNPNSKSS
jgi:hypothetical protein